MLKFNLLLAITFVVTVNGFGSIKDERLFQKYAMIKIYESCFGSEVLVQIRKEMKDACAKCAAMSSVPSRPEPSPSPSPAPSPVPSQVPLSDPFEGIANPENTIYANQQSPDVDKLHQAILSYRPGPTGPSFRPYPGGLQGFYPGFPGTNLPGPIYYPTYQQPIPFGASSFGFPVVAQPYFGNQRMSRDMDISEKLAGLKMKKSSSKFKNMTCVLQELGYLDSNLEPNYRKIGDRIASLPVAEELKRDMQDGISFCMEFSKCLPDTKNKSSTTSELIRTIFFFKCYKHKKLEACIMKDAREKFTVTEEDFDGEMLFQRTGKSAKLSPTEDEVDDLAASIHQFLYGSEASMEIDSLF